MEKTTIDGMENTSSRDTNRICNYDDIPLFLDANDIERLLGLSLTNIYCPAPQKWTVETNFT